MRMRRPDERTPMDTPITAAQVGRAVYSCIRECAATLRADCFDAMQKAYDAALAAGSVGTRLLAEAAGKAAFAYRLLDLGTGIVQQGSTQELRAAAGIDARGIAEAAMELM